jgi:hypothetical protein
MGFTKKDSRVEVGDEIRENILVSFYETISPNRKE